MKSKIVFLRIFLIAILGTAATVWLVATSIRGSVVDHPPLVAVLAILAACGIVVMSILAHLHFVESRSK